MAAPSLAERRAMLERTLHPHIGEHLGISPLLALSSWEQARLLRETSRVEGAEGLMLKAKDSEYVTGRKRGVWFKWKIDPLAIDAVLTAAQPGTGRRASLYTDYTFAVWAGDSLITVAKAYSGLTDEEIRELDGWIRKHTRERFGPVRMVEARRVFEIGFEGISRERPAQVRVRARFPGFCANERTSAWRMPTTSRHLKRCSHPSVRRLAGRYAPEQGGVPAGAGATAVRTRGWRWRFMSSSAKVLRGIQRLNRMGPPRQRPDAEEQARARRKLKPTLSREEAWKQWNEWFDRQGWSPFPFQVEAWQAFDAGRSGLVAVPTGSGKTYAAVGGPLLSLIARPIAGHQPPLTILHHAPQGPGSGHCAGHSTAVGRSGLADRCGSPHRRHDRDGAPQIQRTTAPCPVTTPESLAILLTDQGVGGSDASCSGDHPR